MYPAPLKLKQRTAPPPPAADGAEVSGLYSLRVGEFWRQMRREHASFWMICLYLIIEYVRPQSIIPELDVLPWAKIFLALSALTLMLDKQRRWVADPANKWITLFLLAIIVSSATAIYPDMSWEHFIDFFGWYVIYFLIINIVTTEARLLILLVIFLLCSFKLSLFGARTWAMRGFTLPTGDCRGHPATFRIRVNSPSRC
jgi:putative inorganic carbon (HCO3(-)) transporter